MSNKKQISDYNIDKDITNISEQEVNNMISQYIKKTGNKANPYILSLIKRLHKSPNTIN